MSETTLATRPTASSEVAAFVGMEQRMMLETFKAQCFRNASNVSDAQLAAFVSIARDMKVNPLLPGMLYAYPTTNGGIVPMMGPDGVYKKLMEHPAIDAWETKVFPEEPEKPATHATTTIYLKGKEHVISYTAYLLEWKIGSNPNWNTRPRHMLGLRSLKQAARQVIHGLPYDEDDKIIGDLVNVTGSATDVGSETPPRPAAPKRERGVTAAKNQTSTQAIDVEATSGSTKPAETAQTSEAATPAPVEVVAETVTEKKVEQPAPASEKKIEPVKEPQKAETITSLKDGQRVTFEGLSVASFAKLAINNQPSIKAEVKGAYSGVVYHIGGAENSAWQTAKPVNVTLLGKKLTSGNVITVVEKAEVSSGSESLELS